MDKRKFLVWCSTDRGRAKAELYNPNRLFDVVIHDYGRWHTPTSDRLAEYWIPSYGTEKLETAGANIPALPPYEFYAFLDDDLEISTLELNAVFKVGEKFKLGSFQPTLTKDSIGSWPHLFTQPSCLHARRVPFVEVMCPFFSRAALDICLWSFNLNQSGWGLDCCIWPKLIPAQFVLDSYHIRHAGPFRPAEERVMRNGLNAWQEYEIVKKIDYDGDTPW